jgi:NTP pyrophosphatase (non-canonical NTP hydrolase)|tara:strand:- start:986 stop:1813 length:828 start_codon:yes stop_codon:yes gene_type:complete
MTYYIYHIPGKKVGVTRDLYKRVTQQQGYAEDEYEVLFEGKDIDQVSRLEIELQKSYGYPVEVTPYKDLFKPKNMTVNATEQTSTFPCPLNKLKGNLMDNRGYSWVTPQGYRFSINAENINWIVENAITSRFNDKRCFIYNKAFHEFSLKQFEKQEHSKECCREEYMPFDCIRCWADERGIYDKGDVKTQFSKLVEEVGELAKSILEEDEVEFVDAIGDCIVVLTNLAHLGGYSIEECIEAAWIQIANRKGKMQNGTFVKDDTFSKVLATKSKTL